MQGQLDGKYGSVRPVIQDPYITTVIGDDGGYNCQSKTGACFFCGEIGFEEPEFFIFCDSGAGIANLEENIFLFSIQCQNNVYCTAVR